MESPKSLIHIETVISNRASRDRKIWLHSPVIQIEAQHHWGSLGGRIQYKQVQIENRGVKWKSWGDIPA